MSLIKKIIIFFFFILIGCFPISSIAVNIGEMVSILGKIYGVNTDIKKIDGSELNQLTSMAKGLTGTHSYGSLYDSHVFAEAGGSDPWQQVLSGGSGSALGDIMKTLATQFPMQDSLNSQNATEQEYYRLQAQTTLASRSSSQLAWDQAAKEARTLARLQSEIDRAKDNKSAVDLNNRFASEQADISLEQTKLLSLLVQQAALDAQEKTNRAKEDAEFFNYY